MPTIVILKFMARTNDILSTVLSKKDASLVCSLIFIGNKVHAQTREYEKKICNLRGPALNITFTKRI